MPRSPHPGIHEARLFAAPTVPNSGDLVNLQPACNEHFPVLNCRLEIEAFGNGLAPSVEGLFVSRSSTNEIPGNDSSLCR